MTIDQSKLWDTPLTPMLDEYFSPKNLKPTLTDLVEQDMRSMGLDPNDSNDINKYWEKKGVPTYA